MSGLNWGKRYCNGTIDRSRCIREPDPDTKNPAPWAVVRLRDKAVLASFRTPELAWRYRDLLPEDQREGVKVRHLRGGRASLDPHPLDALARPLRPPGR